MSGKQFQALLKRQLEMNNRKLRLVMTTGLKEAGNNFSLFHTIKHILLRYNWGNYIKTKFG